MSSRYVLRQLVVVGKDLSSGPPRGEGSGAIFPGRPVIFCWAPVIFFGEIFPRKGQDICFFGQSIDIWYEKLR